MEKIKAHILVEHLGKGKASIFLSSKFVTLHVI